MAGLCGWLRVVVVRRLEFITREALPARLALEYFRGRGVCRFLPVVDETLFSCRVVCGELLRVFGLRGEGEVDECLRLGGLELGWKLGFAVRRAFWLVYSPFYFNAFLAWVGLLSGRGPVGVWGWFLLFFYGLPLYTLAWHFLSFFIYRLRLGGRRRFADALSRAGWVFSGLMYVLYPFTVLRFFAYRVAAKVVDPFLERLPAAVPVFSWLGKFFRGLVLLPGWVVDFGGWSVKGVRRRWSGAELRALARGVVSGYIAEFGGRLPAAFRRSLSEVLGALESGLLPVRPLGVGETWDSNAFLLLRGGGGGFPVLVEWAGRRVRMRAEVGVADYYCRELTEYLLLKELLALALLLSGCGGLAVLCSGDVVGAVRGDGVVFAAVYGEVCGGDLDLFLVVSGGGDELMELKRRLAAVGVDLAYVREGEIFRAEFFPLIYNVFFGELCVLKSGIDVDGVRDRLVSMIRERGEEVSRVLWRRGLASLGLAGWMLEAGVDGKAVLTEAFLGVVLLVQSVEVRLGFPPSPKSRIVESPVLRDEMPGWLSLVERLSQMYVAAKRGGDVERSEVAALLREAVILAYEMRS